MHNQVSARVVINLPREIAWEKLQDLTRAHDYVPGVIKTEITTANTTGVGASRRVYQSDSKSLDETVVEWQEGHGFLLRLHRGARGAPPPFAEAQFRYRIDDAGNGQTSLTTTLIYTPAMGLFGRLLDKWLLNKAMRGTIRDVALAMKAYYESGEPTTPERIKQLKAALREQNRNAAQ
ncbi:MAG TPA: SRPBCC family protein [Spongiibacteraceae bacterium]|jgi:hypothetical protein|nr:SRPBCC family protein [Spongiibacteraceae bacterium]HUH36953.1 SRPBCC family protein [Spongiibacteraceae bacterium]